MSELFDQHLAKLLSTRPTGTFGVSYVQRICVLDYSTARQVVHSGLASGQLRQGSKPWKFCMAGRRELIQ